MNISVKVATDKEKESVFNIRKKVFVEEQLVPASLEIDKFENESTHFLATVNGVDAGTARLRWLDSRTAKIERLAVLPHFRKLGVGKALMHALEQTAKEQKAKRIILHAQTPVTPFYEQLGYISYGETFVDAGIEHVAMKKQF